MKYQKFYHLFYIIIKFIINEFSCYINQNNDMYKQQKNQNIGYVNYKQLEVANDTRKLKHVP